MPTGQLCDCSSLLPLGTLLVNQGLSCLCKELGAWNQCIAQASFFLPFIVPIDSMMVQNGCACEQNKQMLFPNIVL